jgi:trehalose/maltose transport system substrate-binding protein
MTRPSLISLRNTLSGCVAVGNRSRVSRGAVALLYLAFVCSLARSEFAETPATSSAIAESPAQQAPIAIREYPKNLRTDLKGARITIALPENAPDEPWDNALIAKFHDLTGIEVQIFRPGNELTAVLATYLHGFESGAPDADVYAIDIVWPGLLAKYAEDLRPQFGELPGVAADLAENDAVDGKLVAVPYFTEISLLYYRKDLLAKYHFDHPPQTWSELEQQARTIQEGERTHGREEFWGYLWQGAASEALTCDALEWQVSDGAGRLLNSDRTLSVDPARTVAAWERAHRWVGTISPSDTPQALEDDSLKTWKSGGAAFMRNWPYAFVEGQGADSTVRGQVGVTVMPKGDGPRSRHADALGGFQLMVSKASHNKAAAIELVRYLTSPEIQRVNAMSRGYAPVRPGFYNTPALKKEPFRAVKVALRKGEIVRPSSAAGAHYDALSAAYFQVVHDVLIGQKSGNAALDKFKTEADKILRGSAPISNSDQF